MFLDSGHVELLTGYKRPARQIEQLRRMGIAFFINALRRPVVPESAIDGPRGGTDAPITWAPAVLTHNKQEGASHGPKANRAPKPAAWNARKG